MEGVPLFEVSKLLRHASIQMTERYAHLARDYLYDAVASLGFQHTENQGDSALPEWRKSSGKWWARLDLNQRPLPCEGSALPTNSPKTP